MDLLRHRRRAMMQQSAGTALFRLVPGSYSSVLSTGQIILSGRNHVSVQNSNVSGTQLAPITPAIQGYDPRSSSENATYKTVTDVLFTLLPGDTVRFVVKDVNASNRNQELRLALATSGSYLSSQTFNAKDSIDYTMTVANTYDITGLYVLYSGANASASFNFSVYVNGVLFFGG